MHGTHASKICSFVGSIPLDDIARL
jgi:hypothetical protein